MSAYSVNKRVVLCFASFLLVGNCNAVSMEVLQEQCAEIGFKIKTPSNGECVLRLMKSVANQQAKEDAEQKAYAKAQAAERAYQNAQAAERMQLELLRQQRAETEALVLRRDAERKADSDRRTSDALMKLGTQLLKSSNPAPVQTYQPPTNCTSRVYGNNVDTSCY